MIQKLKNIFWHLPQSIFWNIYFAFPSKKLTLIGVTGTDGKTTSCTLIQKLLENSGLKCGLISTINSPGLHTTSPDPKILQKIFSDYLKLGYSHVVCEVTSHALDQYRFWGCHFKIGVITNISHEHLDYHKNIENYIAVKSKLFKQSSLAILNRDDEYYLPLKKLIKIPELSYGIENKADIKASNVKISPSSLEFNLNGEKYITDSNYQYQIYNLLACYGVFSQLKLDNQIFKKTIATFPEVKGRREKVDNDLHLNTIVDFAHTPNSLLVTLQSLRQTTLGRIIVIFGATGGRDKSKRPLMGKVVSENADIALITADDTRSEKIEDINSQIISGIDLKKAIEIEVTNPKILNSQIFHFANIPNRQDAFNLAVKIAKAGDTIVACGKGHENTILHGHTEYPWSEADAFRSAFRQKTENV
ncbi:MAG: UDP-N-acetylmuramoyl-L-alanyl-D-glutamate--2,6-diaminopimelate ligase [Candidatus Shapirobacteria bacterium]|jgi:UDP-N-acetylmuramoyl-L-alanyl-D-glutamate--2,6-diaminopimelate ligase|nr:UDP-N-acetylmuramoyl-L-alanyl-D-glutamate--2,6-diaminopimelate ligase [Candidatus Shapirobacteria bacterium]